ncbi:MAG: hypothetical protein JRD05_09170 [Deltaproteobacteria bacterium]|nr:hypothetical protein [Deltaproteobacteria bacterium]
MPRPSGVDSLFYLLPSACHGVAKGEDGCLSLPRRSTGAFNSTRRLSIAGE